jgi:hypothetical protein
MHNDTFVYTPPDPPPLRTGVSGPAKVAVAAALFVGAGFGGFAIAQVATASPATYASRAMPGSQLSNGQSPDQGSLAVSTPSATATPKPGSHRCPNMGSNSSSSGSSTTSVTAY